MGSLLKRLSALSVLALALAGCSGSGTGVPLGSSVNSGGVGNGGSGTTAGGITTGGGVSSNPAGTYIALPTSKLPGVPAVVGANYSFDIGFIDPAAGDYYLADRTSNGVDVYGLNGILKFVAGQGAFTALGSTPPTPATNGGPNGIVPVTGTPYIFAGDGDSTTKVVVNGGPQAPVATLLAVNPITVANIATFSQPASNNYVGVTAGALVGAGAPFNCTPTTGAANRRADEMAYDPADGVVMVVMDASCPPFAMFYSSVPPFNTLGSLAFPYANGGAEQPIYDPIQKKFVLALPSTIQNPGGELVLIDPKKFTITDVFGEPNCNGNGLVQGKGETVFIGCASTSIPQQTVTMNAATGAVISIIPNFGGSDEVAYNPALDRFYGAASNNISVGVGAGAPAAGSPFPITIVADGSGRLVTTIPTSAGAHSIAVDPANDHIWLPTRQAGLLIFGH